ncbi:MAG: SAM-dependent methyltransferase, partial [Comamonadaceae bacterium]
ELRPRRPEFLLRPGELLEACSGLRVVAYEDGFEEAPVQPVRHLLAGTTDVPSRADPASQ